MSKDGSVVIDIEADDSGFNETIGDVESEAKDATKGMDDLGDAAKDAGDGFGVAEIAAGNFVANALSGLISAVGNAVSSFVELSDSTREYREDMAKLETAFSTTGHSTEAATKTYEDFYAILGESDRSVEAVNHLAELTKNEKDLAKWSDIAAGVTAKFGDSLPIEGLTEAANETAKVGKVTGPLADALNWAGISEDDFNKKLEACNSEQERAALITETLNKEYKAAADEYNALTKSTQDARRATSDMEQAQANVGAALEPVTTAWMRFKVQAMEAIVPVVQRAVEWLQKVQQWAEENPQKMEIIKAAVLGLSVALGVLAVALGIGSLINTVKNAFMALNAVMMANPIGIVIAVIAGLVAAFIYLWNNCEGFRNFWLNLWENIKTIASDVGEWLRVFFTETIPQFFSNLFTSIGTFFSDIWTAVSGFFTSLFASIGEFFTNIYNALVAFFSDPFYYIGYALGYILGLITKGVQEVWDFLTVTIPKILGEVVQFIAGLPAKVWEWLLATIAKVIEWAGDMKDKATEAARDFINKAIEKIKELPGEIKTWLDNAVTKAAAFVVDMGAKGLEAAKELLANIVEGAKEIPAKVLQIGKDIVSGVWQGIVAAKDQFFSNVKGFFSGLVDGAKEALDINSPSKKFQYIGEMSGAGLGVGWADEIGNVEKKMRSDLSGLTARVQATVGAENAKAGQSMGNRDTGLYDLARAVGTQTAGINSLASQYRHGAGSMKPVILQLNGRELGRAVVDVGGAEETRVGTRLALGVT